MHTASMQLGGSTSVRCGRANAVCLQPRAFQRRQQPVILSGQTPSRRQPSRGPALLLARSHEEGRDPEAELGTEAPSTSNHDESPEATQPQAASRLPGWATGAALAAVPLLSFAGSLDGALGKLLRSGAAQAQC